MTFREAKLKEAVMFVVSDLIPMEQFWTVEAKVRSGEVQQAPETFGAYKEQLF